MPKTPVVIAQGDCLEIMPKLKADSFDSIVSDPPYGLGFMDKQWDHGVPGVPFWMEAKRVLKPGGYMLVMGGSRTYHRLAVAVEDAGFEIRDCLMWIYGSGFPKAKSCLKPAYEPILLCRKPGKGMRELGVDECRIPTDGESLSGGRVNGSVGQTAHEGWRRPWMEDEEVKAAHVERAKVRLEFAEQLGRWPANILHDGSEEVMEAFAVSGERKSPSPYTRSVGAENQIYGAGRKEAGASGFGIGDSGTAARFFYCAKASKAERDAGLKGMPTKAGIRSNAPRRSEEEKTKPRLNTHPTVKPLALMEWLVKLVTPKGGCTLDPFAGSGTTGVACRNTGRNCVLIEREPAYCEIIRNRVFNGGK